MKENSKTSYEVTVYGSFDVSDSVTFDVDSSIVNVSSDGSVSLVSQENHTGYSDQLYMAIGDQLCTGDFEISSHDVSPQLQLNDTYRGVTYDQIADHMIEKYGEEVTQEHLDWIRGCMRGDIVSPTKELAEISQSSVTH